MDKTTLHSISNNKLNSDHVYIVYTSVTLPLFLSLTEYLNF